ncbi:MAG: hypothetical protein AB7T08_05155, partial [Hyphomonadaceae bacterium]
MTIKPNEAENLWSVGGVDEPEFVLEEDDAFGLGGIETLETIESVEAPPFEDIESIEPDAGFAANDDEPILAAPTMAPAAAIPLPLGDDVVTDQPLPRITI